MTPPAVVVTIDAMSRPCRAAEGGLIYHALNRAVARTTLFDDAGDYETFLHVLAETSSRYAMRLMAYCLMPDHFHLVLWPRGDGDLSNFMRTLTMTHVQRWHAQHRSTGTGHLYQGRYRSFPVQADDHFYTLCRHVERNALSARLVRRAENWRWGSLGRIKFAPRPGDPVLDAWPMERPADWPQRVNAPLSDSEMEPLRRSLQRGQPLGDPDWQRATADRLGLRSTLRPRGRPRKNLENGS